MKRFVQQARGKLASARGVTLVELLVATLIMGFISVVAMVGMTLAYRSYTEVVDQSRVQATLDTLMSVVLSELRLGGDFGVVEESDQLHQLWYTSATRGAGTVSMEVGAAGTLQINDVVSGSVDRSNPREVVSDGVYFDGRLCVSLFHMAYDPDSGQMTVEMTVRAQSGAQASARCVVACLNGSAAAP